MRCAEVRRRLGAEPHASNAELDAHLAECGDCAAYRREMRMLEAGIAAALAWPAVKSGSGAAVEHTDRSSASALPAARAGTAAPRWRTGRVWAVAASVALAALLGLLFVDGRGGDALAADVIAHMAGEPRSWESSRSVPQSALDFVLRRSGVRLERAELGEVVYAHACFFRGRWVPHLVVRSTEGPVTVMVLAGERVRAETPFAEGGYFGVIAPAAGGAVAVLSREPGQVAEPLRRVRAALAEPD